LGFNNVFIESKRFFGGLGNVFFWAAGLGSDVCPFLVLPNAKALAIAKYFMTRA